MTRPRHRSLFCPQARQPARRSITWWDDDALRLDLECRADGGHRVRCGGAAQTTYLGIPYVTLLANTERPITVTQGANMLVGEDLERAWNVCVSALAAPYPAAQPIDGWDGAASVRVLDAIVETWSPTGRGS